MLAVRQQPAIEEAIRQGRVYLAQLERNGCFKLAACAIAFELLNGKYFELGSIRVPGEGGLGGFRMQTVFVASASLQLLAEKYIGEDVYGPEVVFATIDPLNHSVQHEKLLHAGMRIWESPPAELLEAKSNTIVRGSKKPTFYILDENNIPNLAKFIFDISANKRPLIRTSRQSHLKYDSLDLSLDLNITRRWLDLLQELSLNADADLFDEDWYL